MTATHLDRPLLRPPPAHFAPRAIDVAEALDFAEETVIEAQKSRRFAWIVASLLIVVCGAQAAAIAIMMPLKDLVPYTLVVDRQTGYMETARALQPGPLQDDEAVVTALVAQYVLQRETFDPADFKARYERVALWSGGAARADYVNALSRGALPEDLRPGSIVTTRIKSIEIIDGAGARVRFDATRRDPGAAPVTTEWQAHLGFRFTGAPMRMEDRIVNPLGFQVMSYRRDPEFVASAPPPAPVSAPAVSQPSAAPAPRRQGARAQGAKTQDIGPSP